MTPRAWKMLALGGIVIATTAGFAATAGHSSPSTKTAAHWGLYSSESWNVVAARFARRGFARGSVRIVTATRLANGQPFALISARSNTGRTCFAVARGVALRAALCRISKPLTVFSAPDTCAPCTLGRSPLKTHAILGLVRGDVTVTMISLGHESGMGVVPAGTGFAFNAGYARAGDRVRARNAAGRVLASITFHSS